LEWSAGIAIGDCVSGSVRKCKQSDGVPFQRNKFSCWWVKRLHSKIEKSFPGTSGLGADGACYSCLPWKPAGGGRRSHSRLLMLVGLGWDTWGLLVAVTVGHTFSWWPIQTSGFQHY
jgi:hypothetical protein